MSEPPEKERVDGDQTVHPEPDHELSKDKSSVNGRDFGFEGDPKENNVCIVPVVDGWAATEFDEPEPSELEEFLSASETLTLETQRAVMRVYLGMDKRSLRTVAADLKVTPAAVSKQWRILLKKTGSARLYSHAEKRAKLAAAARRTCNSRKRVAA